MSLPGSLARPCLQARRVDGILKIDCKQISHSLSILGPLPLLSYLWEGGSGVDIRFAHIPFEFPAPCHRTAALRISGRSRFFSPSLLTREQLWQES